MFKDIAWKYTWTYDLLSFTKISPPISTKKEGPIFSKKMHSYDHGYFIVQIYSNTELLNAQKTPEVAPEDIIYNSTQNYIDTARQCFLWLYSPINLTKNGASGFVIEWETSFRAIVQPYDHGKRFITEVFQCTGSQCVWYSVGSNRNCTAL